MKSVAIVREGPQGFVDLKAIIEASPLKPSYSCNIEEV